MNKQEIQECIPVGCVLSTAVAISEGSVRLGVSAQGVSAQGGVCRGASVGGVSQGGVCPGGVCPGECLPHHPPVNRISDACENITLPQLCCGP